MQYSWAQGEETTNVPEAKPKSIFMNCNSRVPAEKLETFLLQMADDLYRAKGFVDLEEQGWSQVDLVDIGGHQALRATATVAVGVHLQNRSAGHPQAGRDLGAAGWSADAAEKLGGATDDGTKGHRRRLR